MIDALTIGDKIDISLARKNGNNVVHSNGDILQPHKTKRNYVSQLLDIKGYDIIKVAMPMDGSTLIPLMVMKEYSFCFYTKKGLYICNGIITSREKENNVYYAMVKISSKIEKFQRREYYRLECALDILYRKIDSKEADIIKRDNQNGIIDLTRLLIEEDALEWNKSVLTDISGGGARFITSKPLESQDLVQLRVDLGDSFQGYGVKTLGATVISSLEVVDKVGSYENRVEFILLRQTERDDIIKFIFDMQRKIRQNHND